MSTFTEKVKGVVRSRSKSRNSQSFGDSRTSDEFVPRKSYEAMGGNRTTSRELQKSRTPDSPTHTDGILNDFRSMNINDQNATPSSKNLPPLPSDASKRINQAATGHSIDDENSHSTSSHSVPPRISSAVSRKPVGGSITPPRSPTTPATTGHRPARSVDGASHDPSPLVPGQSSRIGGQSNASHLPNFQHNATGFTENGNSATREPVNGRYSSHQSSGSRSYQQPAGGVRSERTGAGNVPLPENVQLPPGFSVRNATETVVDTAWQPSVTQETVRIQKTEVIQPVITRDIHVDHYYHYTQPIKVVEVLPAKHYRLDERTGEKIEIPAPEGFILPEYMRPGPITETDLHAITRHYVVDEQSPYGRAEDPPSPLRNKHDVRELNYNKLQR